MRLPMRKIRTALHPDLRDMGPAMCALNDRQRLFVISLLDCGGNQTRAAIEAGYSPNPATVRTAGYALAHNTKIQAAILECARARLTTGTVLATSFVTDVIANEGAQVKDRLKAAQMLMDRGGLPAMTEHKSTVEHVMDKDQMVQRITALAEKMGMDPARLLGNTAPKQIEATVIDVTPNETLEDLL